MNADLEQVLGHGSVLVDVFSPIRVQQGLQAAEVFSGLWSA